MDFITDLSPINNYNSMFMVVDRFSKAIIVSPCRKNIIAEQTSKLYLKQVWWRTGQPKQVISDKGPQFTLKVRQVLLGTSMVM
jgi:hypothetical protein